jgi:hypothetical protein
MPPTTLTLSIQPGIPSGGIRPAVLRALPKSRPRADQGLRRPPPPPRLRRRRHRRRRRRGRHRCQHARTTTAAAAAATAPTTAAAAAAAAATAPATAVEAGRAALLRRPPPPDAAHQGLALTHGTGPSPDRFPGAGVVHAAEHGGVRPDGPPGAVGQRGVGAWEAPGGGWDRGTAVTNRRAGGWAAVGGCDGVECGHGGGAVVWWWG